MATATPDRRRLGAEHHQSDRMGPTRDAHRAAPAEHHQSDQIGPTGDAERGGGEGEARPITGARATEIIRALASRQHGVVARRQLLEAGLGVALIRRRVERGQLVAVHEGVYAVGVRRHDRREEMMAAVLAGGSGAVLSHASAAELWGLRGSAGALEITRASGWTTQAELRVHQSVLPEDDVTREAGIPVTTVERTLRDIAPRLDRRQMERVLVEADRSGRLSWPKLERVIAAGRGCRGIVVLREVAAAADPRAADALSTAEVDFLAVCREAELPPPAVNALVQGLMVDFLWPSARLIVEVDGYRYHAGRLAHERDRRRSAALGLAGYRVERVTPRMLEDAPEQVVALIRRALADRA